MAKSRVDTKHIVPGGPGRTAENDIDAGEALKIGSAATYYDVATTYQDFVGVALADADSGGVVEIGGPGTICMVRAGSAVVDGDPLVPTTAGAWIPQTNDDVFYCGRALSAASASGEFFWAQIYPPTEGGNISLLTTGS